MFAVRGKSNKGGLLMTVIAFGAMAYAVVMLVMSHTGILNRPSSQTVSGQKATQAAAGNVPNGILHQVAKQLNNVSAVNELYVQAAPTGGYIVSATAQVNSKATNQQIKTVINNYLQGLYGGSVNVSDAQIYILQNGIIVAGAGLGRSAYNKLASTTETKPFSLTQQLKTPGITSQGVNNDWLESQVPASP
ncbi:hypothetical protein [Alicyclobacillus sp. SO9]|uniref:hypothetical protein n=1 Tax=Alicyclobacillus sp. SO9 TaxID=2665646 RepID=UPI0018E8C60E|nr:hypothetical protein [Alicyclobacillus sp. SO9]QQE80865.1 hypothetical protein GI364_11060 [Alicyclobacillus sp. SO9]